jgi:hypothetical protein
MFWRKSKFEKTFGFKPSRIPGMRAHEKAVIAKKLEERAQNFYLYEQNERELQNETVETGATLEETEKNLRDYQTRLQWRREDVQHAKKRFWEEHKLAKDRGYKVKDKYMEYVSESYQEIFRYRS